MAARRSNLRRPFCGLLSTDIGKIYRFPILLLLPLRIADSTFSAFPSCRPMLLLCLLQFFPEKPLRLFRIRPDIFHLIRFFQ